MVCHKHGYEGCGGPARGRRATPSTASHQLLQEDRCEGGDTQRARSRSQTFGSSRQPEVLRRRLNPGRTNVQTESLSAGGRNPESEGQEGWENIKKSLH
jgi:hypothetical protein